jgi:hypothetical protein
MGLIRNAASTTMLSGMSSHTRREPPGKAERARHHARDAPSRQRAETSRRACTTVRSG